MFPPGLESGRGKRGASQGTTPGGLRCIAAAPGGGEPALVFPLPPFPGRAPFLFYYPIQARIAAPAAWVFLTKGPRAFYTVGVDGVKARVCPNRPRRFAGPVF